MKPRRIRIAALAALMAVAIAASLSVAARSNSAAATSARSSHVVGYFIEWGIYGRTTRSRT